MTLKPFYSKLSSTQRCRRFLTTSNCPITGTTSSVPNDIPINKAEDVGKLNSRPYKDIPGPSIYPFIGSIPDLIEKGSLNASGLAFYKKYGPIAKHNAMGEEVFIFDPREYLKVFREEGKYPVASIGQVWPLAKLRKTLRMSNIVVDGEAWKEIRLKLQPDLLSPQAVESYIPLLWEVGKQASEVFPSTAHIPDEFAARVSFDMFAASILGKSRGSLFPRTVLKEDSDFVLNSTNGLRQLGVLFASPYENVMHRYDVDTAGYKKFAHLMKLVNDRANELVQESTSDIAERQKNLIAKPLSYLQRLLISGTLKPEDAGFEVSGLLGAAVDTTSTYMSWMMFNLAKNPDKQKLLATELKEVLKGGDYNKEKLPYLQACYRETHRLTPTATGALRVLDHDIVLNGYNIPAGIRLRFELESIQKDPTIVDSPESFHPERWLPR